MSTMSKLVPLKPFLLTLYGFPGSGKTYFARQFAEHIQAAHIQADRVRHELFDNPSYSKQENAVVQHIMDYMVEEFLRAGVSVVYDTNALRTAQRRSLRTLAKRAGAETIQVWQQIDPDAAAMRVMKRDRRKADDKFGRQPDAATYKHIASAMQNPSTTEDYIVVSGKHVFNTQFNTVLRSLYQRGLIKPDHRSDKVAMPGLVNLVPNPQAGRVDMSRRNITIR